MLGVVSQLLIAVPFTHIKAINNSKMLKRQSAVKVSLTQTVKPPCLDMIVRIGMANLRLCQTQSHGTPPAGSTAIPIPTAARGMSSAAISRARVAGERHLIRQRRNGYGMICWTMRGGSARRTNAGSGPMLTWNGWWRIREFRSRLKGVGRPAIPRSSDSWCRLRIAFEVSAVCQDHARTGKGAC